MPQIWLLRHRNNEFIIFCARFWPNFNVVDYTWQFLIRTFCESQPSPIQRSSYFKLLSIAPPAPVKYSFSNRCLSFFSVLLLLFQETRCFPSQNIFFLSMLQTLSCKIFLLSFLQSFSCFYSLWFFVPLSVTLLPICRRMKCNMNSPSLMVAAVPQKIRCKIRGKCCKSGVKWAKVGPAGWKEPLSASALLPCQLLTPSLPHTLFNFQLEATPKKSAEEFCKFLSLSHSICPTLRLARIELKFWRHYFL